MLRMEPGSVEIDVHQIGLPSGRGEFGLHGRGIGEERLVSHFGGGKWVIGTQPGAGAGVASCATPLVARDRVGLRVDGIVVDVVDRSRRSARRAP